MVDAVIGWNIRDCKRVNALQAANVVTVLVWVGAALMMSVDATVATEIVLCGARIELIELQVLCALEDTDTAQSHGSDNRAFAPADGAVTAAWVDDAVWQVELQLHRATVTGSAMFGMNLDATNFLEYQQSLL